MNTNNKANNQIISSFAKKDPKDALVEILINILIPIVILSNFSSEERLGIKLSIIIAFALPLTYGLYDYLRTKNKNFFSILGVISVSLSGGLTLLEVDAIYIALKEASIPLIFAFAIIYTMRGDKSLLHHLMENPIIVNADSILVSLKKNNQLDKYNNLLRKCTAIFAASFMLSAILNFFLAIFVLTGEPGTEQFNHQMAKMLALSFPINAVPPMIINIINLLYLFNKMKVFTGLKLEQIMRS